MIEKLLFLDCRVAKAPRDDDAGSSLYTKPHKSSLRGVQRRGNPGIFQISLLFLFLFQTPAHAFDKPIEQNYFASLRSSETNVRAGPGSQYPIKFTFKLRSLPVKVISEYDNWSEIKDYEGDTGWVSQNLITKKRTVVIKTNKSFVNLYAKPSEKSKVVLRLENDVVGDFIKCSLEYCGIKVVGKKGWVLKKEIWGIDENDIYKEEN